MVGFFSRFFGKGSNKAKAQPAEVQKDILQNAKEKFGFECIKVHGKDAWSEWQKIRSEGEFYPVILGPESEIEYLSDNFEYQDVSDLSGVDDLVFPDLYLEELKVEAAAYDDSEDPYSFDLEEAVESQLADWTDEAFTDGPPVTEPIVVQNYSGKYHKEVYLAKIKTDDWTTIPALLRFGGFNACPGNEWHASAIRHWREKYQVELVSLTHDILELRAGKRPQTKEDAVRLSMEQYFYCSDIVSQGVDDPNNLAKILMAQDFWYFWWD